MRKRGKVDANHNEIVAALRAAGCAVQSLAAVGNGCPDLLVSRNGRLWLMEIKARAGKLTEAQKRFAEAFRSHIYVVRDVADALAVIEPD